MSSGNGRANAGNRDAATNSPRTLRQSQVSNRPCWLNPDHQPSASITAPHTSTIGTGPTSTPRAPATS